MENSLTSWRAPQPGRDVIRPGELRPAAILELPLRKRDGAAFRSADAYGHLCTVTGAYWTPRGRFFDGVDDIIKVPYVIPAATHLFWVKSANNADYRGIVTRTNAAGLGYASLCIYAGSLQLRVHNGLNVKTISSAFDTEWHLVGADFAGAAGMRLFIDGQLVASDPDTRSYYTGAGVTETRIGHYSVAGGGGNFSGWIGEAMSSRLRWTEPQVRAYYLAAKGVYR